MSVRKELPFRQVNDLALGQYPDILFQWFPNGTLVDGKREFAIGDLSGSPGGRDGGSVKVKIATGEWAEMNGGDPSGGDPISLYAWAFCGGKMGEACRRLGAELGVPGCEPPKDANVVPFVPKNPPRQPEQDDWQPIVPPPADVPDPNLSRYDHVFVYRDRAGQLLRYVVRNDARPGQDRYIRPMTYGTYKGKPGWELKGPNDPKSLYGLERLDGRPVLLQEGEKKTDQVAALLPGHACLSLTGGTGQADHTDLSPLGGLPVLLGPDNDKGGLDTMRRVAAKLAALGCAVLLLDVSSHGFPDKWDLGNAAEGEMWKDSKLVWKDPDGPWPAEKIETFIRDNAKPFDAAEAKKKRAASRDLDGFARNEDGIALAFAERFRGQLRYCHTTGAWFVWTGTRWQREETRLAFCWAREVCRELNSEGENFIAKAATAGAVEKFAQADRAFAVTGAIWDRDSFLLGTPGGTVDLTTGLLMTARRDDYMTKQTAVTPADPLHGEGCPLWLAFLEQATKGDKELIRFMQQIAGYALTGDTREHALFFIYGPGGNGKGVFLNTITKIIGDYATTAAMDTFTASQSDKHPTDLAKLKGARLVTASETEEGRAWAESRIKQMTGGDRISARFMRQDFFEFDPNFKLLIVGNHKPILRNVDEAARRRFNIIPFVHKPEKKDQQLEKKLEAERAAILRWMIDGCLDWQRNGLIRPASVGKATADYFNSQDLFGQWLEECCELFPGKDNRLETAADLFASWKEFAESNGEQVGSGKAFGDKLTQHDVGSAQRRVLGKKCKMRTGISLVRPPLNGTDDD